MKYNFTIRHQVKWSSCVQWSDDRARYHIWLDDDDQPYGPIYKNPPSGIEYRAPGYYHTRKLNADAKSNADVMRAVRDFVGDGQWIAKERNAFYEREEQERLREVEQRAKDARVRDAAPALLEALRALVDAASAYDKSEETANRLHAALDVGQTAIRAAEGTQ